MRAPYQVKVCLNKGNDVKSEYFIYLGKIHKEIVNDMKCSRHEVQFLCTQ